MPTSNRFPVRGRLTHSQASTAQAAKDEVYILSGLNMVAPDQLIDTATRRYNKQLLGQSPYTINSRMLSRDSNEQRVSIRTRKGSSLLFGMHTSTVTPLAIASTGTAATELMFSATQQLASPIQVPVFTLTYGLYSLTFLDLFIRKTPGYVESIQIRIWTDGGGIPGTMVAESSFTPSTITSLSTKQRVYFMDAPDLDSNQKLYMTLDVVGVSTVQCFVQANTNVGGIYRDSSMAGSPWFKANSSVSFTSSLYRSGSCLSAFRRNVQNEVPTTIVATGYGDVIKFDDAGKETLVYAYSPGYQQLNHRFRFAQIDNRTVMVNGLIQPQYYDGSTVTALTNAPLAAEEVFVWENYLFMRVGNKFQFSDELISLAAMNSWPSVNYFYPNTIADPDSVVGSVVLKNVLYIFTKKKKYKYLMTGAGIDTGSVVVMEGSKGAIAKDLITTDGDFIYFISEDKRMYMFNGISDVLISDNVEPEIRSVQNPETNAFLHVHNNLIRYYYARSPSTIVSNMLLYDLTYHQWFMDTGRNVAFSITYPLEELPLVEFSSKTTMAFLGEQGYSDAGKPLDFKYWTNYKAYGSGAAKKRIKRFRPILKIEGRRYTMRIGKDMDFKNQPDMRDYVVNGGVTTYGEGAQYGDGSKYGGNPLVDNHAGMSGRGRHVQFRFEKKGVDTPVELYGYIALFKEGTNK